MDAEDLIKGSLRLCGVRLPSTTQLDEALTALNQMINIWNAENLMVYDIVKESFTLTSGTSIYTIGSGGDFDTDRPQKIIDAFIRDDSDCDHPVDVTMTEKEYNAIYEKGVDQRPERLYYRPSYSLGYIYFDSEPDSAETLYLDSWKQIDELAALTTTVSLPKEYESALRFNFAVFIAPEYGITLDKTVIQLASITKNILENFNVPIVGRAEFDSALTWSTLR